MEIEMDFRNQRDQATIYCGLDGSNWIVIGTILRMNYDLKHFMGYSCALLSYAPQATGGHVVFDDYRLAP